MFGTSFPAAGSFCSFGPSLSVSFSAKCKAVFAFWGGGAETRRMSVFGFSDVIAVFMCNDLLVYFDCPWFVDYLGLKESNSKGPCLDLLQAVEWAVKFLKDSYFLFLMSNNRSTTGRLFAVTAFPLSFVHLFHIVPQYLDVQQ